MKCCKQFVKKSFQAGDTICSYGKERKMTGIMKGGEAKLLKLHSDGRQVTLEYFTKDSIFGEAFTLQGDYMEELRVVCTKHAVIEFISYDVLLGKCEQNCPNHMEILDYVLRQLSAKAVLLNERVQVLTQLTIREKLRCYFQLMEARNNKKTFDIPYSYTGLAEYLSVDRSAMMRELKMMQEEGEICRKKRNISLLLL